jgi:hypothetical protein
MKIMHDWRHNNVPPIDRLARLVRVPAALMNNGTGEDQMLWVISAILVILWLLGLVTGYTMSSFIHVLLVLAIIIELIRIDEAEVRANTTRPQIKD